MVSPLLGSPARAVPPPRRSFSMLHSPLDHLNQRDAICRILHAKMDKEQQKSRPMHDRKVIVISQVFAQEKFQMQVFDSRKGHKGPTASHVPQFTKPGAPPSARGRGSSSRGRARGALRRANSSASTGSPDVQRRSSARATVPSAVVRPRRTQSSGGTKAGSGSVPGVRSETRKRPL